MNGRQRVEQAVVQASLGPGRGLVDVGVEHRSRAGDVAPHPGHDEEGCADPAGVGDDEGRRRRGYAGGGHRVLHGGLRAQVVVGEGRRQGGKPHHDARVPRTEVHEHRLVRQAPVRVGQRRNRG